MADDDIEMPDEGMLLLAAEECPRDAFDHFHVFTKYENSIVSRLMSHGPVLLRGGRGSGKSALLIEAHLTLQRKHAKTVIPVYISLRHLPLLRSSGQEYISNFCAILSREINRELFSRSGTHFPISRDLGALIEALEANAQALEKRIVLLFDDAAHIGRERPLEEFFDIFRTISTSRVSCKASIYPGVTKFGIRFDVYNDATVIDISRDERKSDFAEIFQAIIRKRFSSLEEKISRSRSITPQMFSRLLGRAVNGNLRSFIFACNALLDENNLGLADISKCMLNLGTNYFWPLLEEVEPKLGSYSVLVDPSQHIAQYIFTSCASRSASYCLVHRDLIQKMAKMFEILEYAGFLSRREASKALKSGGRGVVYSVNLCNVLEHIPARRLTTDLVERWLGTNDDPYEIHSSNVDFSRIVVPELNEGQEIAILNSPIEDLKRSNAYPYGLTDHKIERLKSAKLNFVKDVFEATDEQILAIRGIGRRSLNTIRNVLNQAVWM